MKHAWRTGSLPCALSKHHPSRPAMMSPPAEPANHAQRQPPWAAINGPVLYSQNTTPWARGDVVALQAGQPRASTATMDCCRLSTVEPQPHDSQFFRSNSKSVASQDLLPCSSFLGPRSSNTTILIQNRHHKATSQSVQPLPSPKSLRNKQGRQLWAPHFPRLVKGKIL